MIMKGQKISDRYQIIKTIGEGGMANVYLAYDTILDRNVAVKILRGELATDEKFVRRFQREALSASSLSNPNIVEVYDVGEDNGQYYIVMEYIEGKHLKALLKKRGKLTVTEVVDIMLQITNGLSVAHDSYIIHRDIKPQNIMILENGLVKITDFGIAMAMNAAQLTQTNSVMGSVHYLPPEQANGKGATLQSDIYSMGILMYELLTGNLPYKGDNAIEIALKHLKEPLPSIKDELPNLPQSVENIILKSAAKNPKNRYEDARTMNEDLKTCLDPSRENEELWVYKYPETENNDAKSLKILKNQKKEEKTDKIEEIVKNNKSEKEKDEDKPVVRKITGEDMKKQNKLLIVLISIFTGIVVMITTMFVLIPVMTNKETKKVPNVSGMTETEAVKKLQDAGFVVSEKNEQVSSSDVEEGKVVKTSPVAESKRKKGSEIKLYLSIGDASITIEDYTGKNCFEIKGALEAQGLLVSIEKKTMDTETDDIPDENSIIEQSLEPDTKVSEGSQIILYIPNILSEYPDFTDGTWTLDDIEEFVGKYELQYEAVAKENDGTHGEFEIYRQSRQAGEKIVKGAIFKVYYYSSPIDDSNGEDENDSSMLD